jgi:hypothetical protein
MCGLELETMEQRKCGVRRSRRTAWRKWKTIHREPGWRPQSTALLRATWPIDQVELGADSLKSCVSKNQPMFRGLENLPSNTIGQG